MLRLLPLPILLVAALVAAGCGSGGSSTTSTGAPAAVTTTPASGGATARATVSTTKGPLGTFLVDGRGRTLYLFEKDQGTTSACSGACAAAWPPLLTKGAAMATSAAKTGSLGTTKRSDGTTQVTYGGHPLYTFVQDTSPGQTNGQGSTAFGAAWYVVAPSGSKITQGGAGGTTTMPGGTTTTPGGGGGGTY